MSIEAELKAGLERLKAENEALRARGNGAIAKLKELASAAPSL